MLQDLTTEQRNPNSLNLDRLSAAEIVNLMNTEDAGVAAAVARERQPIADAIAVIADSFQAGGRLFYIGAGTSGRLGVLDAAECPPTFNTPPELVVGLIAGGPPALTKAVEGAEDSTTLGADDLRAHNFSSADVLVGIASSGRTPYVLGGLKYARQLGAKTVGVTCNLNSELHQHAEIMIAPVVGPEILSGSTRLKAGTATKMVLNMLTTGAMILIGKTYGNLMVDVRASNIKLQHRSQRIVSEITGLTSDQASLLLQRCDGEVKTAIVCCLRDTPVEMARMMLAKCRGRLSDALHESQT